MAPTLQFLLPNLLSFVVMYPLASKLRFWIADIGLAATLGSEDLLQSTPSALYNVGFSALLGKYEEGKWTKRYGSYVPYTQTTILDLWFWVIQMSLFFLCICFFSRIFPPLPDQVAGNNVSTDIRRQAQLSTSSSSNNKRNNKTAVGWGGGGAGATTTTSSSSKKASSSSSASASPLLTLDSQHHHHHHNQQQQQQVEPVSVWTERQHPISTENRFKLHRAVLFWRLLDIWICCGWLPRSDWLARALGHVPSHKHLPHQLAQDLYPIGIVRPFRPDILLQFWEKQIRDPPSLVWLLWSLSILPTALLIVQMLYLNRTYLSISSYFATQWTAIGLASVDKGDVTISTTASIATPGSSPKSPSVGIWDSGKKYKKDDLVISDGFLYQATTTQTCEGKPVHPSLRYWQDLSLYELGHVGTSKIIAVAFACQLLSTLSMAVWWLVTFFYQDRVPDGLLVAVVANLVGCHALSMVGMTNHDELNLVNNAILGQLSPSPVAGVGRNKNDTGGNSNSGNDAGEQ